MEEERPSTLPFATSFNPSNPLGALDELLDFIGQKSNFLIKDTAEKEIVTAVTAAITKERQRKTEEESVIMTLEPETTPPEESGEKMSKKAAKKEAAKLEKLRRKKEQQEEESSRNATSMSLEDDEYSSNYGDVILSGLPDPKAETWRKAVEGKEWTDVSDLVGEMVGSEVLIRGRVHTVRSGMFVILRQSGFTVQCVAKKSEETKVSANMINFLKELSDESIVEVIGVVSLPKDPVTGATQQQVEIQVRKVYCLSRSLPKLPLIPEDAARSEADIEKSEKDAAKRTTGRRKRYVRILQDTRLNNRVLDLRTPANQAIFTLTCRFKYTFAELLSSKGFIDINTPRILGGSSEGGSAVFRFDYKGKPACLAQSPQLYKQMAICADFPRVFVIGPVFRAEDSFSHRHLCEFTGVDVEMGIQRDYTELMDQVDHLFLPTFTKINEMFSKELETVRKQYPFEPLKFHEKTLRLTFEEGIQILKEAGVEIDPFGDLNTESERRLGQLIREKYNTDFYILYRFPLAVRPFYTMPCEDDPRYSKSFDVFLRGEEIISGGQRIHDPEMLEKRARECGINVETISTYIDSFRYGAPPHGGFGMGLERVVMLFCGLDNIRKTSLFPRDPHRLAPKLYITKTTMLLPFYFLIIYWFNSFCRIYKYTTHK
ncbi:PREDICTED: aspartate--tRNA ligase 1, cytoplasmic-like [Camelina sativa]|uniref:aspartate--tRNA ligase n=1 Tax=Camelina sativa TaxID=90675 RepID=A0ABM0U5W8_CAMSA|nr:PREDICTED: aspartate--tRNA ligase 1, cytoplasmic-like [Camelina sativa]